MEQNKREFYKEMSDRNAKEMKTIKTIRSVNLKNDGYQGYKYKSSNNEQEFTFKNKFFMQTLTVLGIIGCFYMLTRNDSALSKSIIQKTKDVLETSINIESVEKNLEEIKQNFNFTPSIVKGNEYKVYIDDEEILKMEQDSEEKPKN